MHVSYRFLMLAVAAIFLLSLWGCEDDELGPMPSAEFSTDKSVVEVGEQVDFTNLSTIVNNSQLSFEWDFGDGTSSQSRSPVKSYDQTGRYTVTLTTTSGDGQAMDFSDTVTVGARLLTGIVIADIPLDKLEDPNDPNSNFVPWDEDDSGPDLIVQFGRSSEQDWDLQNQMAISDVEESDLPIGLSTDGLGYFLEDRMYDFFILDEDENGTVEEIFGGFEFMNGVDSEVTVHFDANDVLQQGKDPETGEGIMGIGDAENFVVFFFTIEVP